MTSSNILYFCTFIVSYKNESMAKKVQKYRIFEDVMKKVEIFLYLCHPN